MPNFSPFEISHLWIAKRRDRAKLWQGQRGCQGLHSGSKFKVQRFAISYEAHERNSLTLNLEH